jgi:hypothetical protein
MRFIIDTQMPLAQFVAEVLRELCRPAGVTEARPTAESVNAPSPGTSSGEVPVTIRVESSAGTGYFEFAVQPAYHAHMVVDGVVVAINRLLREIEMAGRIRQTATKMSVQAKPDA